MAEQCAPTRLWWAQLSPAGLGAPVRLDPEEQPQQFPLVVEGRDGSVVAYQFGDYNGAPVIRFLRLGRD